MRSGPLSLVESVSVPPPALLEPVSVSVSVSGSFSRTVTSLEPSSLSLSDGPNLSSGSGFGRGVKVNVASLFSLDSPSQPSTSTEMISPAPISPKRIFSER